MLPLGFLSYVYLNEACELFRTVRKTLEVSRTLVYSVVAVFFSLLLHGVLLFVRGLFGAYGEIAITDGEFLKCKIFYGQAFLRYFYGFGDVAAASQLAE